MKAIIRYQYGSPDVIQVKEIEKPQAKDNEVLIRVFATTVNRTDCGILTGKPYAIRFFTGLRKPSSPILGTDFAGRVEHVGSKVSDFKVGDRVWGLHDEGIASQAEYMTIKDNQAITTIPDHISYSDAAACAEGAHYAYNFVNYAKVKKGDKVLVNGATGGIGSAALQILKHYGAIVTAVGNTKNLDLLKSLGADKIYNYEEVDFTEIDDEQYHFVFDAVGKSTFGKCKRLLLPKGIYISSELGPGAENLYLPITTKIKGGKRVIFPIPKNRKKSILFIKSLLEKNEFRAVIDRTYPIEAVQEAYEYVASGQKTGNVILDFEGS